MDNQISAVMTATMSKIKEMVDTNTVVGEPITTPDDITLIPLSRVSFAFASGGSEFPMKENKNGVGCGSGAGVKVEPMGFLIVKDGNVRMLNVMPPASNTFDRLIDMTPQVFDRIDRFIDRRKADKAIIRALSAHNKHRPKLQKGGACFETDDICAPVRARHALAVCAARLCRRDGQCGTGRHRRASGDRNGAL